MLQRGTNQFQSKNAASAVEFPTAKQNPDELIASLRAKNNFKGWQTQNGC